MEMMRSNPKTISRNLQVMTDYFRIYDSMPPDLPQSISRGSPVFRCLKGYVQKHRSSAEERQFFHQGFETKKML